ncbi:hypothetical protein MMC17_008093 [Xylographa soralifera]|nr:hypothetical protein [Xylographa soralifera]
MSYSIVAGVCQHHIRFDDQLPYPESGTNHDFSILYCPECSRTQDLIPAHVPNTAYSIVAGVCQHHIRFDAQLPYPLSKSNQDFSVPYCPGCLDDATIIPRHSEALNEYFLYDDLDPDHPKRYEARRRLDVARIDRKHQEYNYENHTRDLLASRPAHLQPIPLTPEEREFIHRPSARIDTATEHVDEEYYRGHGAYCRGTNDYLPGRYADTSGQGYLNTSNPAAARREARGRVRAASDGRKRDATPHPGKSELYDEAELQELMDQQAAAEEEEEEEQEERIRRLKDKLYKYRDVED